MKKFIKYFRLTSILSVIILFFAVLNGFGNFGNSEKINSNTGNDDEKFSMVRMFAVNDQDFQRIMQAGLIIDHANHKPGRFLDAWLSASEFQMLKNSGVPYEILIDDFVEYEKTLPKMTEAEIDAAMRESEERFNVSHSIYGTMRNQGHIKYSEIVNKLDSLRLEYPALVSQKFSIGNSYENKTIWAVRITKNPDAPTGKPEVLYHSLIHAREPVSMSSQLYYVYWLVENYGVDPLATYILNNREIYWIPVFNPDGYVYNETGSGNWRKNRKPCSGGIGTDLNRNYGIYQYWNAPNGGSSTSCGSDTYRGTTPFSEPETQAVANFVNSRNFRAGFGAHTHGNLLIKPWAWCDPTPTSDDAMFNVFLADMKASNPIYITGTPYQTVHYYVRGCADDFYYNDSAHTKAFVMTPETGQTFWPQQSAIMPLVQGMLFNNRYISLIAGPYVNYVSANFNQSTYTPGSSGTYRIRFKNKGVMAANNTKIILTPGNGNVTIPTQQYNFNVGVFQQDSAAFNFTVSSGAPNNCYVPAFLTIKMDTSTIYTQGVYIPVGTPTATVVLNDNAENGIGNWTTEGGWSLHTDSYHSATHSFAYAPYTNDINHSLTLSVPLNIQTAPVCNLSFWSRHSLETNYDFGYVEVSNDNGNNWQAVTTINGNNLNWTQYSFDITTPANASTAMKVRFRLNSDANTLGSGWWVDDIVITKYCVGTPVGISGNTNVPDRFAIGQNYPNPFNPVTLIKYQLPSAEKVSIKVFDILGKEVAVLVNESKEPGYYEVNFDAANLASGLYFYRIEAGSFTETKKMMLIK
jgi:carboxypeptidase T